MSAFKKMERRDFLRTMGIGATAAICGCGDSVRGIAPETATTADGPASDRLAAPPRAAAAADVTPAMTADPDAGVGSRGARLSARPDTAPGGMFGETPGAASLATASRPNVLFITADDMAFDSLGVHGCAVPEITPNLDRLAGEGIRFEHAHVNIAVCQPCRGTIATGRYPHRSGIEGFEHTTLRIPTIMQELRDAGYLTGVLSKVDHSTPHGGYEWDLRVGRLDLCNGRAPRRYYKHAMRMFERSRRSGRPFYLMANIQDPHRPFAGANSGKKKLKSCNFPPPNREYRSDEVTVPGYLPDLPDVRRETAQYYGSVHRADESVGQLLAALDDAGMRERTIVIFLSDHGASFPFSKANCYPASTHVPWIVRWPGQIAPGSVDRTHFIATIDFMPTLLDALALPIPEGLDGRSFLPLLKGGVQAGRDRVFKQLHRTVRDDPYPMRAVEDRRFCYIFNAWADGHRSYRSESVQGLSYSAMREAAKTDQAMRARVRFFDHRTQEELYDLTADPHCLVNLAGDPARAGDLRAMKETLDEWMAGVGDPALSAFRNPTSESEQRKLIRAILRKADTAAKAGKAPASGFAGADTVAAPGQAKKLDAGPRGKRRPAAGERGRRRFRGRSPGDGRQPQADTDG